MGGDLKQLLEATETVVGDSISRLVAALVEMGVPPEDGNRAVCTVLGRVLGVYAGATAVTMQDTRGVPISEGIALILQKVCDVAARTARAEISSWFN